MTARPPRPAQQTSRDLVHELQVHQAELELQNQQLIETQHQLESSRNRYFALFDLAPLPYISLGRSHDILEVNAAAAELLGAERHRLIGRPFALDVAQEYRGVFHDHVNAAFADDTLRVLELRICPRASAARTVRLHSHRAVRSPRVDDLSCLTAIVDLTAQREAERAVSESNRLAADLVRNLPTALFLYRFQPPDRWTLIDTNPVAGQLAGFTGGEGNGLELGSGWPTALLLPYRERLVASMATGDLFETDVVTQRGGEIEAAFRVRAFSLPADRLAVTFETMTEYRQTEARLRASLDEKVVLLQEVHHRVKNNLQLVVSMLNLQANRESSPESAAALSEARDRVRSIALLHEGLYRTPNLARLDVVTYVEGLCGHLRSTLGSTDAPIQITTHVAHVSLEMVHAVPCGLILNELVGNAVKHAFRHGEAGEIVVTLELDGTDRVRLSVVDNGAGMDPDAPRGATLGMQLVRSLAGQLGGALTVRRQEPRGTRCDVVFPLVTGA